MCVRIKSIHYNINYFSYTVSHVVLSNMKEKSTYSYSSINVTTLPEPKTPVPVGRILLIEPWMIAVIVVMLVLIIVIIAVLAWCIYKMCVKR